MKKQQRNFMNRFINIINTYNNSGNNSNNIITIFTLLLLLLLFWMINSPKSISFSKKIINIWITFFL